MVLPELDRNDPFSVVPENPFEVLAPELGFTSTTPARLRESLGERYVAAPPPTMLSLVIPAYNEEDRIARTVREYAETLRPLNHEILVEVDGSSDRTADLVRDIQSDYETVKLVEFTNRLGKGRGVLEGMERAAGDWIAYVDADGSTPPREFMRVAALAFSNGADAVIATRYWDRARMVREYGFMRWTASRAFNFLVRHAFDLPYRDTQCGTKMFRRDAVMAVIPKMKLTDYAFDVELLWRLQTEGYQITEVPIRWHHRDGSTVQIAHVATRMFLDVIRLRVAP